MTLTVDTQSYDFQNLKTLNEDVKLVSDICGKYDLNMDNGDYVNVTGNASLRNACVIAILTRYRELKNNPTYTQFGCRAHELIKDNKTKMFRYKLELSLTETLEKMRRIKTVNWFEITENEANSFNVFFNITSINDEIVTGEMVL